MNASSVSSHKAPNSGSESELGNEAPSDETVKPTRGLIVLGLVCLGIGVGFGIVMSTVTLLR